MVSAPFAITFRRVTILIVSDSARPMHLMHFVMVGDVDTARNDGLTWLRWRIRQQTYGKA